MPKFANADLAKWKTEINAGPIVASRIKIQRENSEWVGLCPFHDEKTPSFKVYRLDGGVWCYKCFGCGANGNVFQFIQKFDKVSFTKAVETVLEIAGVSGWKEGEVQATAEGIDDEPVKKPLVTYPAIQYMPSCTALAHSREGFNWLAARGIGADVASKLRLGFVQSCSDISPNHPWRDGGWILFPTFSEDGHTVITVKYRSLVGKKETVDEKQVSGILRLPHTATVLYNAWTVSPLEDVFVVEGEPDVVVLEQCGFPAVGYPSGEYTPTDADVDHLKKARRRFLAGDSDKTGRAAMEKLGKMLPDGSYILQWPAGCKDANETLLKFCKGSVDQFASLLDALKAEALEHPLVEEAVVRDGTEITPKRIAWLWPERVPMGKITLFAGNPDNGKSLATASVTSLVSTGEPFPNSTAKRKPADVLMLIGEDDLDDTVIPRLMSANANLKRIHFLEGVRHTTGVESEIRLDHHTAAIEKQLISNPKIQLVVIDPISNYLGDVSMVAEQEVRSILIPLKRIASKYNVAFILVMHLNKKNDLDAISRVGGAMAFIGVARCSWLFARDAAPEAEEGVAPVIPDTFKMLRIKNNLVKADKSGLAYSTNTHRISLGADGYDLVPYIKWGGVVANSADDVLNGGGKRHNAPGAGRPASQGPTPKLQKAIDWLQKALVDGPQDSKTLFAESKQGEGITEEMLRNAKDALRVAHSKVGKAGKVHWMWALPKMHESSDGLADRDNQPHETSLAIDEEPV